MQQGKKRVCWCALVFVGLYSDSVTCGRMWRGCEEDLRREKSHLKRVILFLKRSSTVAFHWLEADSEETAATGFLNFRNSGSGILFFILAFFFSAFPCSYTQCHDGIGC